jgi:HEPN domain-containing protein
MKSKHCTKEWRFGESVRLSEAHTLFAGGHHDGAYYLAGYVIECAIKACIAKPTAAHDFPPRPDDVRRMYSHNLVELVKVAELEGAWLSELAADPIFARYWRVVANWNEQGRYARWTERQAADLLEAAANQDHGVLQWLQGFW